MIRNLVASALLLCSLTAQAGTPYDFNAVTLTRFAMHTLYAPKRLVTTPEGVHRVPMQTDKHVPLFYGASIDAMPLASWRADAGYVTAVELKNLLNHPISIDMKTIQGDWLTAVLYPSAQLPAREQHDTTTIFLVSTQPFQEALHGIKEYVR
jgi:integrating conjugative element protein (TIGR03749 family)